MRCVLLFTGLIVAAAISATSPAYADPPSGRGLAEIEVVKPRAERLNDLYSSLKRERNASAAERLAGRIQKEWKDSGNGAIDLMVQWASEASSKEKYDVALDFLDQVVTLQPDYAEGWNQRATVHYKMHNYRKSMSDVERTLKLEPRHFGALAGMAQILKETGHKEMALVAFQRVLDVYPMMRKAQDEVAALSDELAGEGI